MKPFLKHLCAPAALLVAALVLFSLIIPLSAASWPQRIQSFERADPVYTATVPAGTAAGDLGLPASLRAVVPLPEAADPATFVLAAPAAGDPEIGQASRIYGSLDGGEAQWYAADANGKPVGAVVDVPVTWTCENYDGSALGDYTFTANITGYMYSGARPIAKITVSDQITEPVLGDTPVTPDVPEDLPYDGPPLCTCQGGTDHIHDPNNPDCPLFGQDTVEIIILKTGEKAVMVSDAANRIADAQAQGQILYPGLGKIDIVLGSFQSGLGYDKDMVIL